MPDAPPTLAQAFRQNGKFAHVAAVCPHCMNHVGFGEVKPAELRDHEPDRILGLHRVHVGYCRTCHQLVIGIFNRKETQGSTLVWPTVQWPDNAPLGLDVEIKKAYDEARAVIGLSPQAAATLARRCVQHVIRKKMSITKKRLFEEIEEAVTKDDLSKSTKAAIDHVRKIGAWGAHPIEDQASVLIEVSEKEARYTLEAVELLFNDLYVTPHKVASMGKAIGQKKTGQATPQAASNP